MAALLCGLALAACGSDSDNDSGGGGASDEDQVRESPSRSRAMTPAACSKITAEFLKQQFGSKEECEKSAEAPGEKPAVEDVKVDGETATAVVIDEDRSTLEFVKESDEWLASGIEVEEGGGK
jgi:hypothetical protein